MTLVVIPNRPLPTDNRDINAILADFDAITTAINGNLDRTNISPTSGVQLLQYKNFGVNTIIAAGDFAVPTANGLTLTLPAVAANTVCAFVGRTGLTVSGGGATIFGGGLPPAGAANFPLALGTAILQSDGISWTIISGKLDSGWVGLSLAGGMMAAASDYAPASRQLGDTGYLRGAIQNSTGGTFAAGTTVATIAAGAGRPTGGYIQSSTDLGQSTPILPVAAVTPSTLQVSAPGGLITLGAGFPNNYYLYLDSLAPYSIF